MKILKRYKSIFAGLIVFLTMILVGFGINSYFFFAHVEIIRHLSDWVTKHRICVVFWHVVLIVSLCGLLLLHNRRYQQSQSLTAQQIKKLKQFQWLVLMSLVVMDVIFLWG